jgi:crossover junction endodeoxyribonuclease RuvC
MKILGVDPGSLRTGYAVIEARGNRLVLLTSGSIKLPNKLDFPEKLKMIKSEISTRIREHAPDSMVVETLFYRKNVKSALKLGHVRGVILLAAAEAGIDLHEYSPGEIKMAVSGNGRASKDQVQEMVVRILGVKTEPESYDASDAMAIAVCHAHSAKYKKMLK